MADNRIIAALDVHTLDDMKRLVYKLGDSVSFYKVGMELFYSAGPDTVRWLKGEGKQVFLDLKIHDIPNTAAQAVRALTGLGADLMTLHGSGGSAMLKAAAVAAADEARRLAVTVLTSIDADEWQKLGHTNSISQSVLTMAGAAKAAGMDGTVSSPHEAAEIRRLNGPDFLIVTPGIRPSFAQSDDQKRITTPKEAVQNGATHLVVGRPITKAADPQEAARAIAEEIREV